MKLVYFGTSEFAVPALCRLASHVALVVTQPDRPQGRGQRNLVPTPVKKAASKLGIPVETPEKSRSKQFVEYLQSLDPDVFIVASYGQILSKALLNVPKAGCFNLHASVLPEYRGAAPIQRAVADGQIFTGISLMEMDEGLDTGPVIKVETTSIGQDETAGGLEDRLSHLAADLIEAWLPVLLTGEYEAIPQDASKASYAHKVEKTEAKIEFDGEAAEVYNRIRAFTPAPGAHFYDLRGIVKLREVRPLPGASGKPGEILAVKPELVVACQTGALTLITVQPEGKKAVSGRDYANGKRLRPGDNILE